MTKEDWYLSHALRKDGTKRRGPAPKKMKTVWDLSPGDRGTADRPSEPLDLNELERQLEETMMDEYIRQQAEEAQFPKGKCLRKDHLAQPKRPLSKSFWV